jgi:hypothetical protein
MAAEFLADLAAAGQTVVTLLRNDQYIEVASFTEVGCAGCLVDPRSFPCQSVPSSAG